MSCKEEDDSRLTPAEGNDAAGRKIDRKECLLLIEDQYKYQKTANSSLSKFLYSIVFTAPIIKPHFA